MPFFTIPSERGEPTIKIFESLEALQAATGQHICHGFFDAGTNTILATPDSVAHEVGHFLDFKSGGLKNPDLELDPLKRTELRLRNEIVAVLFAYAKCGEGGASLIYESRFVEWLKFSLKSEDFSHAPHRELPNLALKEIQDLADWLVTPDQPWFDRLCHFFRSYLIDERSISTYGRNYVRV